MRVVRSCDNNKLHIRIGQRLIEIGKSANAFSLFREHAGTHFGIARDNAMQSQSGLTADERTVKRAPGQPVSDHNRRNHVLNGPLKFGLKSNGTARAAHLSARTWLRPYLV
jgi:hypothetical protein